MNDTIPEDDWLFADRYRVDAPIGTGGMGKVWAGYDKHLDRRVAIKLMHQSTVLAGGAEGDALAEAAALDRERFLREIRTMARLELPGIPAVYDFGIEDATGRIYLVMQLAYGPTLRQLIDSRLDDPWPIGWAAAIAAQVAATLVDVHRVDVVHRDIKPSNLIVGVGGLVKVLDFGVAILQGARALPKLTQIGLTVGSPPYMPPEQVLGNPVGPASDIYALGCVLYEMLTGGVPFVETATRSYRDHHVNSPPPVPGAARPDVPAALDELVPAMLAKRPGVRPDASAVYDALSALARSGPTDPPGTADPAAGDDPRRPFLRPLAPAPRPRSAPPAARATHDAALTVDEALAIQEQVADLLANAQFQQAIELLDDAVTRSTHEPALQLQMRVDLATALYTADEFTRAAATLDAILPSLKDSSEAPLLRYYAGVSHAEIGDVEPAITFLTAYLPNADHDDPLYQDAIYQLGTLLPAAGRPADGLRHLQDLRPLLVADYGPNSLHVRRLDQRIAQIRTQANG